MRALVVSTHHAPPEGHSRPEPRKAIVVKPFGLAKNGSDRRFQADERTCEDPSDNDAIMG
jgi:hypothetical protein